MATDLARAHRACARTTRRHARNFYFAFLSLPRAQRRAVYALYAFCHMADCVVDEPKTAPSEANNARLQDLAVRQAKLDALRERLACAAAGRPKAREDLALADAIARFGVREEDLRDVLTGVEMDLTTTRIESLDKLRSYCYHVASAVGLATLPILTDAEPPTDEMRAAAVDLGLGMQYVNILRDVDEDLTLGRIYLPTEELAAHGVDETQWRARMMTDGIRSLLAAHADRAQIHLRAGRRLLALLPRRGRACPWLLSEIYGRILTQILKADLDVFGARTSLPVVEKLWLLLSSPWKTV